MATNISDKTFDIVRPEYDKAQAFALQNQDARAFTDHGKKHVRMVKKKSKEAGQAILQATNVEIDWKVLSGAALAHDTGMNGEGYYLTLTKQNNGGTYPGYVVSGGGKISCETSFATIRSNHALNSALNVLKNRPQYTKAGYNDKQIDLIAIECMAHSKSCSGLQNLNSKDDWKEFFDRIEYAISLYNQDHPQDPIMFKTPKSAIRNHISLNTEILALRIGDVSRDSGPNALSQSGERVHVSRKTINDCGNTQEKEIQSATITIGMGKRKTPVTNKVSRRVHAGEQNIIKNGTYIKKHGHGVIVHEITVANGSSAPCCTIQAIHDHIHELMCDTTMNFEVKIKFQKKCTDRSKELYQNFQTELFGETTNISLFFPWDWEVRLWKNFRHPKTN